MCRDQLVESHDHLQLQLRDEKFVSAAWCYPSGGKRGKCCCCDKETLQGFKKEGSGSCHMET